MVWAPFAVDVVVADFQRSGPSHWEVSPAKVSSTLFNSHSQLKDSSIKLATCGSISEQRYSEMYRMGKVLGMYQQPTLFSSLPHRPYRNNLSIGWGHSIYSAPNFVSLAIWLDLFIRVSALVRHGGELHKLRPGSPLPLWSGRKLNVLMASPKV